MASANGKAIVDDRPSVDDHSHELGRVAVGVIMNPRRGSGIEDDLLIGDALVTRSEGDRVDRGWKGRGLHGIRRRIRADCSGSWLSEGYASTITARWSTRVAVGRAVPLATECTFRRDRWLRRQTSEPVPS